MTDSLDKQWALTFSPMIAEPRYVNWTGFDWAFAAWVQTELERLS